MTDGERLEEIVQRAVARGTRRRTGCCRNWRNWRTAGYCAAPDETGMPEVCDEVITTARTAG
jgi:hypothetical protein